MYENRAIPSIITNGDSGVLDIAQLTDKWLWAHISAGSFILKTSGDGTNYIDGPTVTASGKFEVPENATHAKITATGLTNVSTFIRGDNPATS